MMDVSRENPAPELNRDKRNEDWRGGEEKERKLESRQLEVEVGEKRKWERKEVEEEKERSVRIGMEERVCGREAREKRGERGVLGLRRVRYGQGLVLL